MERRRYSEIAKYYFRAVVGEKSLLHSKPSFPQVNECNRLVTTIKSRSSGSLFIELPLRTVESRTVGQYLCPHKAEAQKKEGDLKRL